ncbi:ABC transporter substrate-binding protein [Vagococcus intermedius]|uniref:ABC transporter substrate-binding protein n=1 Tax=Vagococcus intermedius TaxID=2991418 RepID=A0AAF0CT62_9ENTE|nr:ABC transporter substrate-binding protein [Vagococcus intermedius]WEG72485.1 ABC transporter substrate-binding protein [Vagococcus intermedius]WEG74572.1 ABC transporter substrate-binding protein [Vagococcus intermedius]
MEKKKIIPILMLGALVLGGCSTNQKSEKSDKAQVTDKDTFTYAINGDPTSLNPINVSDRWGLTVTNMIYSPLVRVEGDGTQKMELAEKLEPTDKGKALVVELKENVKWSDGQPFTADDVVFTYEQKVKKENGGADTLWIDDKPIKAEKLDEHTVKFNLPSANAAAINNIATETYIIPEHIFKKEGDFSGSELKGEPVGTGPYKLDKYQRGEYLQFSANETYYGNKATVPKVNLRIISSADTTKVALQKGEVDASYISPNNIKDLDGTKLDTYEYSENRVGYLGLNNNSEKLKDVKVRQAIFYALNKDDLNKAAYLSDKYYENAYSFLPPNNPFYSDKVEKYETDITKAKTLLGEADAKDLKLNLAFASDDPIQTLQATLMQQQLQQVGITVELAGGDGTAMFAELKKSDTTKYDLFIGGYIMGTDPDLYTSLFKSDGSANYFHYANKKVDDLFNQGAIELDEAKRHIIYENLQKELMDEAVIYPIVDSRKVLAVNNRIEGIKESGLVPIYTFEDLSKIKIK